MRDKIKNGAAIFGIVVIIAMFANLAMFINSQSSQSIESPVISAFIG